MRSTATSMAPAPLAPRWYRGCWSRVEVLPEKLRAEIKRRRDKGATLDGLIAFARSKGAALSRSGLDR